MFEMMDADNSGTLDAGEIAVLAKSLRGRQATAEELAVDLEQLGLLQTHTAKVRSHNISLSSKKRIENVCK